MRFRFLHAADLHIDSPLRGLDAYDGAPVERLRGATRQALKGLVQTALDETVDVVVLAGDIFDGDWADFRTGLFFHAQMQRLQRAGIRVFIARGNHDAQSLITRQLPAIEGVHVFDATQAETVDLPALGLAVHGRSFPQRAVFDDLLADYPAPRPQRFNIGVLHTSLSGRPGHEPYAPTSVDALVAKAYDYFALGHVHAREIVREAHPRIVFPGNLQGRHARETGPKGCELVTVEAGRVVAAEFVAVDAVRWHQLRIDVSALDTIDQLADRVAQDLSAVAASAPDRLHAVRVQVDGRSALSGIEARRPGTLAAAVHAAASGLDGGEVWVETVGMCLRAPIDRAAAAQRSDAIGELIRLVDALGEDETPLRAWYEAGLAELGTMPAEIVHDEFARPTTDALRELLGDVEATVLARLFDQESERGAGHTLADDQSPS